jgi:Protein of unknown function (DUF1688)
VIDALFSAAPVRVRAHLLLDHARAGRLLHFSLHEERLGACVDRVIAVTRQNYPTLDMPFHARWRHFRAGTRDLWQELDAATAWESSEARLRAAYDLVIVSVLLDAGAGMGWRFKEPLTGAAAARSEGLGLASLDMVRRGVFSAVPGEPLRVDGAKLASLTVETLAEGFQVSPANPLVGLEGRAALLNRLGAMLIARSGNKPAANASRPSCVADGLLQRAAMGLPVTAPTILEEVLHTFRTIWPDRPGALPGCGDVWTHPLMQAGGVAPDAVPFHKLSQWLSYSLIEPLNWIGIEVRDVDGLTGLPEYRNGGLFLDAGVIALKDSADAARAHDVGSTLVVEWRALTVALLDLVAEQMRAKLGLGAAELPLAKVLEGGTWATGRVLARERRSDGGPPLTVISDGTVF